MELMNARLTIFLLATVLLHGCTIDGFEDQDVSFDENDTQITGQIIGESISENQNGMLSTFSEAFAIPAETTLRNGPSLLSTGTFRNLKNYAYTYNSENGTHTVTYTTQNETPFVSTSTEVTLKYIFYDQNESIIEFPDQQRDIIEAVEFSSEHSGEITAGSKNSIFTRIDQLFMDGLTDESDILTLDGFHSGEGIFTQILPSGAVLEREYLLDMNYLDVRVKKSMVQTNRNFRKGVNGALSYESTIRETNGGQAEAKIINGTIELNGDGTALLQFREQIEPYRLRLDDGELFDEDEFEGRVTRVNLNEQIFTLTNGQRIKIDEHTEIDDDGLRSLEEVSAAIDNGVRIVAEGDYFHPDEDVNLWVATEVEFETEKNEFEDLVSSINLTENSILLFNGDRFYLDENSEIKFDDDFLSLADVAEAVENGLPVVAEGEFIIHPEQGTRMITEIEFEFEFEEFEKIVESVNLNEQSFTLVNGKIIVVNERTEIDDDGDFVTLEELSEALDNGMTVEADGDYYFDPINSYWIAVEVEFKLEDDDDDGDED